MKRSVLMLGVFALLFAFCGLAFAEEFTVDTAEELSAALVTAGSNGEDDTITLRAGTYEVSGDVTFVYEATAYDEGNLTLMADGEVVLDGGGTSQVLSIKSVNYMTDITLVGLTVVSGDHGSGGAGAQVDIQAGNINVRGCNFTENTSAESGGGLYAHIEDNGSIRMTNCEFSGNSVSDNGGGVHGEIEQTGDVVVEDCVFTGNICDANGGAAYLYSHVGDLTVSRVTATGNSSRSEGDGGGGAFYLEQDYSGTTTIKDSMFTGNTSSSSGGAVCFEPDTSNTFVCTGNTFISNRAEAEGGEGGAIYEYSETCSTAVLVDNVFRENIASYGGGAYLMFNEGGVMDVESNDFIDNFAVDYGGGLYVGGGYDGYYGETTISIDDCLFEGNENETEGGAGGGLYACLYTDGGSLFVLNSSFSSNTATNGYAGGAYLEGNYGNVYLAGNDFSDNGSSGRGGGLYSYVYYGNFYLGESTFDGNVVSGDNDGGGAYLDCEYGDVTVERSTFTNNSCEEYGGGFYLYQDYGDLVFRDNLIANNTSAWDGGGAYLESEYVRYADIVNNTVTANMVSGGGFVGGGLYIGCEHANTICSISNNIIWGNEAGGASDDIFLCDNNGDVSYINYFYVDNNDYSVLTTDFTASSDLYESARMNVDPLFVSSTDFHLQADSSLIDMGDSEARSIGEVDIEGKIRVHGDAVDMGAYEFGSSLAGEGGEGDEGDGESTGGSSGGCSVGSFAPALLLLVAPLTLLVRKR